MNNFAKISDVARALGIPASTLRFWESEGLIQFPRSKESNYRQFSFNTMLRICNIMLYRNLELPLPMIKQIDRFNDEELYSLFSETEEDLQKRIDHYQNVITRIHQQQANIRKYQMLAQEQPKVIRKRLPAITKFDFKNAEMVQKYLQDPSLSADIIRFDAQRNSFVSECGLFISLPETQSLRPGDSIDSPYFYGLIWFDDEENSNLEAFYNEAQALSLKTDGTFICRYLTAFNPEHQSYREYYEAWLVIVED